MASQFDYDLLVLGAGSGGLATAKRAASYGARVAIVEKDRVGGTCVIRGCVPKKLMVYAAEYGRSFSDAAGFGWSGVFPELSWKDLKRDRDAAVDGLERTHERLLKEARVELLRGRGYVAGPHAIEIDGQNHTAGHILIATGGAPVLPSIEGIENAITSDGFFELPHRPNHAVVVGGGYIAVEFASILNGLGTDVSLVIRRDLPLRGFDQDLRRELFDALVSDGVDVRSGTVVETIRPADDGLELEIDGPGGPSTLRSDTALIYAVGRRPNTSGIGLDEVGVELGKTGEVLADGDGHTSVKSIFAIGDVTNRAPLTPVAIQAGRALADRVFGGKDTKMSYDDIPTAVFTSPPIGTVGLTEEQAIDKYGIDDISTFKAGFTPLVHMLTERKVRTFVKMIVHKSTDRVLGCHMIGHDAGEIIQGLGVAIKAGATKADFDATVGIHPSSAEEFVTLT